MNTFRLLLSGLPLLFAFSNIEAQCPAGQDVVRLEINSDEYFSELSWILGSTNGSIEYGTGTLPDSATHVFEYCVPHDECVKFALYDSFNDGFFPDGWYKLFVNDTLVYALVNNPFFGSLDTAIINCPPGTSCTGPIYLNLGTGVTPSAGETWFSVTPVDTGLYIFSTCAATCSTKISVYDRCAGIFLTEDQTGTIIFADSGCPNGAAVTNLHLAGGKEYFIRVRYASSGCSSEPIPYDFSFQGPIVGCMDPEACNYNPLATIQGDTCIYPGNPACPQAPDLAVNSAVLRNSVWFSQMQNVDACTVDEGCLRGFGTRYLVEFTTQIQNVGDADYYIGSPPDDIHEPSTQFVYDQCHGHWHYMGYAEYLLYNSAGYRFPVGSKTGFCVLDQCPVFIDGKYDCNNMGITAGCSDTYQSGLPCQWVDVTDLPADDYTMVVRVNWDKSPDKIGRVEKKYDNNWAQVCFNLSYSGNTPDVAFSTDSCPPYKDCTGEIFGNAQPDCNGLCNGPALFGDWNQDTLRNAADVDAYLAVSLANTGAPTNCNDLHADGIINVYDAALLQECNLHANNPQHWVQQFPCQFPTGLLNGQDPMNLRAGVLDTVAKTFEVQISNPYNRVLAYEFLVSGLKITSVENLEPTFHATPQFNAATGKILALAADESTLPKHPMPTSFLRIHYAEITADEVCVSQIVAIVNSKYQRSKASIVSPNCVPVNTVAVGEPTRAPFAVYLQPNPMREYCTLFFENPNAEPTSFSLRDVTGRTLRSVTDLRDDSIRIERDNLPSGTYFFSLMNARGSVSGKLTIE